MALRKQLEAKEQEVAAQKKAAVEAPNVSAVSEELSKAKETLA